MLSRVVYIHELVITVLLLYSLMYDLYLLRLYFVSPGTEVSRVLGYLLRLLMTLGDSPVVAPSDLPVC